MVKEMPRRYWKNLPEARMIAPLVAGAQAKEAAMTAQEVVPDQRARTIEGLSLARPLTPRDLVLDPALERFV